MRFAPEYVANVLSDNFEDAKRLFLAPLLSIHYAHLVMLVEQSIISAEDGHRLRTALDRIQPDEVQHAVFDGTFEDLFFYVERLIDQAAGVDVAGRLHTARSRNDIDMTMYRMRQRGWVLDLLGATLGVRRALLDLADQHRETIMPAHTHTQPAQPTTVAHYLLGAVEQLERDAGRLKASYATTNRNPLGSCAITGTGFPIDRVRTSELLGFDGPTGNTYGSIATVDYLLESLAALSVTLVGLGRVLQDLLLWCTQEFGFLRLRDRFVQGSSIMPQKRNPVALEHARGLASRALGEATGVLVAVHNTPFGDIVDTEDDLQPLVHAAFRDAVRAVRLVAAAMTGADVDVPALRARAGEGWITATELADTLVRRNGLPFRAAHDVTAKFIAGLEREPGAPKAVVLASVSRELLGDALQYSDDDLARVLSPEYFVEVRQTHGGPAPGETAKAIVACRGALDSDAAWLDARTAALEQAGRTLRVRAGEL